MIAFMKSWCEGIIVAVMISIIIELLIPEGSNKKYVKVVIGIYILFVILSPILKEVNNVQIFEDFVEFDSIEVSSNIDENIKEVYVDGIEDTIKNDLIQKGYVVKNVKIEVDKKYENIEKIEIFLENTVSEEIKIDTIEITQKESSEEEYKDLKQFIENNYQIQNIHVFEHK